MEDKYLLLLLQVIDYGEGLDILKNIGLEYYSISKYVSYALEKEYIKVYDKDTRVTELGKKVISSLSMQIDKNKNGLNIRPLIEKRVKKIDKFDIYIPK